MSSPATGRRFPLKLVLGIVGVAVVGWLAFGFFGVHTLFVDDEVSEAPPVFDSGASISGLPADDVTDEVLAEMNRVMADEGIRAEAEVDEAAPGGEVVELAGGDFIPRAHRAEGSAVVLNDGTEQRFLRFEEGFETDNGPDLNVYLATGDADSGELGDFVDLGDLKGNIGPQNYEIPPDVDLAQFSTVVVWCVRFGVAFAAADLS